MAAYSMDLRERIIKDVGNGLSARSAAGKYHVSNSFAIQLVRQWRENGTYEPKQIGGYKRSVLDKHKQMLFQWVEKEGDLTLEEIQIRLANKEIKTSVTSVWRFFERHGFSHKKNAARRRATTP